MERMLRYARQIAKGVASRWNLDEEFVEFLLLFAPAHDAGKIAVPYAVLLKSGALSAEELAIMHNHVTKGPRLVRASSEGRKRWKRQCRPPARDVPDSLRVHPAASKG